MSLSNQNFYNNFFICNLKRVLYPAFQHEILFWLFAIGVSLVILGPSTQSFTSNRGSVSKSISYRYTVHFLSTYEHSELCCGCFSYCDYVLHAYKLYS